MTIMINLCRELKSKANPKKAKLLQRYFKTGKGEYGEGDIFWGIAVPEIRKITRKYSDLKLKEISELLKSKIHEERLSALLILVEQFQQFLRGVVLQHNTMLKHSAMARHSARRHGVVINHHTTISERVKKQISDFYLRNTKYINNWDLVDLSAPKIVGEYLMRPEITNSTRMSRINTNILYKLAKSKNLWERRIAVLATFAFIRENKFSDSLKIAEMLLNDKEDLIHKAVGWMLREVGKRSVKTLEKFLKKHASKMPRVMLGYAMERLAEGERTWYLKNR